jgi:hypothetical protein
MPSFNTPSFPSPSVPKSTFSVPRFESSIPDTSPPHYPLAGSPPTSPSVTPSFPSTPKALGLTLPSSKDWPAQKTFLPDKLLGTKLKVWKYPVLDPSEVLGVKKAKRKRRR